MKYKRMLMIILIANNLNHNTINVSLETSTTINIML